MTKESIRKVLEGFCSLMLEKDPEVQSVKVIVETKNKTKVKFKKFRKYPKKWIKKN